MVYSLKGQFLVATPDIGDQRFSESVIYLVGHSEDGAMGLIVNQLLPDMHFVDILEEMNLGPRDKIIKLPQDIQKTEVLRGGPVEKTRGFVLHSADCFWQDASYLVDRDICLTATTDALEAISFGPAPQNSLFALGCCGWSPGQLENEIKLNGWLTLESSTNLLFDIPIDQKYDQALSEIGVTRASLSPFSGNA